MQLDMLAKLRQLGPYTFFLTGSAAEFHWPEVVQIVAKQYGTNLSIEDINSMDWNTKRIWLQHNPVTVARQIDYIFEQLWSKVILSGAHPIGQILNYDRRKEMQGRGTEHFHAAVHVKDAPRLDRETDDQCIATHIIFFDLRAEFSKKNVGGRKKNLKNCPPFIFLFGLRAKI